MPEPAADEEEDDGDEDDDAEEEEEDDAQQEADGSAPPPPAWEFVGDGSDDALVAINNEHSQTVAALAARRCGVTPAAALGAVLSTAGTEGATIQLWDGTMHKVQLGGNRTIPPPTSAVDVRREGLLRWLRAAIDD